MFICMHAFTWSDLLYKCACSWTADSAQLKLNYLRSSSLNLFCLCLFLVSSVTSSSNYGSSQSQARFAFGSSNKVRERGSGLAGARRWPCLRARSTRCSNNLPLLIVFTSLHGDHCLPAIQLTSYNLHNVAWRPLIIRAAYTIFWFLLDPPIVTCLYGVAGSTTEDLSVQVFPGNLLQISGELKKGSYGGGTSWGEWHTVERPGGVFLRQFQIEGDIRVDEIEVVAQDGVLTITIPKKRPLVRTIPIASVL